MSCVLANNGGKVFLFGCEISLLLLLAARGGEWKVLAEKCFRKTKRERGETASLIWPERTNVQGVRKENY